MYPPGHRPAANLAEALAAAFFRALAPALKLQILRKQGADPMAAYLQVSTEFPLTPAEMEALRKAAGIMVPKMGP